MVRERTYDRYLRSVCWYVAVCPQFGQSRAVPPVGKVGLLAKKKFSKVSLTWECAKAELHFGQIKTQLAMAELRVIAVI